MSDKLHVSGLYAMTLLALCLLGLVAYAFYQIGSHITPDGKVPAAEAFGLTALLLSFREVIGTVRGIWDTDSRDKLTTKLADAQPGAAPAPQNAADAAKEVAGAAQERSDEIAGEKP